MDDIISILLDVIHAIVIWFTKIHFSKAIAIIAITSIIGAMYMILFSEVATLIALMFW